jgi:Fe2+ or Zn2+ uptake regulation protein
MNTPYADYLRLDMRLQLLRVLAEMPGERSNSSILADMLERFGHTASRDQVKTELGWLAEQGLLALEDAGSVRVATLAERGKDVATGRAVVSGVKRHGA